MTWSTNGINYVCQEYGDANQCVISSGLIFNYTDTQGQSYTGVTGSSADIVGFIIFGIVQSITMTTPSRPTINDPQSALNNTNGSSVTSADAQLLTQHDENSGDQWCYTAPVTCTNPSGNQGNLVCGNSSYGQDPTHLYKCDNGVWVDQGYDPNCASPPTCSNPSGIEGDIICGNETYGQDPTHRYYCNWGTWLDQGLDPTCTGTGCEGLDETACNAATGCYWYKKWLWEQPACHTEPQDTTREYMIYAGIGVGALGFILLLRRLYG